MRPGPLPWRAIVGWALLGTVVMVAIVMCQVGTGTGGALSLVEPGARGPSAAAVRADFPHIGLDPGLGLDGQQFYAVARDPFHLQSTSGNLDRPRYRLQRPLFPLLAWVLHPEGGGTGLIVAFVIVGALGLLLGGIATGVLAVTFGGSPVLAGVFALLPGAYLSLRYTLADALALALAVAAIAASARGHSRRAILIGVLAVLAKETCLVLFVGWAIARRTRGRVLLVVVPLLVAGAWGLVLWFAVPAGHAPGHELGLPFVGLVEAGTRIWGHGYEPWGMLCTFAALVLGGVALGRQGLRHPLSWTVVASLGFVALMGADVVGMDFGSPRSMMPLHLIAILMLATAATPAVARMARPTLAGGLEQPTDTDGIAEPAADHDVDAVRLG